MLAYIIEDDLVMGECVGRALEQELGAEVCLFGDAFSAISAINERLPDVIFLNILLNGPNGFALLNELNSYDDTARIPVILLSDLGLSANTLHQYRIEQILNKETMRPTDIVAAAQSALTLNQESHYAQ